MTFVPVLIFMVVLGYVFIAVMKSKKVIKENKRGVVFRLGKFHEILNPGFHLIMPFIDECKLIDINEEIPNWNSFSEEDLNSKIEEIAIRKLT